MSSAPPVANSMLKAITAGATNDKHQNIAKHCLVERMEGETPKEFERRRNQVYGKRRYRKRKQELEAMKKKAKQLHQTNERLARDNRRLEYLCLQCQEILLSLDPTTSYANFCCYSDSVNSEWTDMSFFS